MGRSQDSAGLEDSAIPGDVGVAREWRRCEQRRRMGSSHCLRELALLFPSFLENSGEVEQGRPLPLNGEGPWWP